MRTAIALFLVLSAAVSALGQSRVTGVVRDESGAVVSGATVLVMGASGVQAQTVTGPDGSFSLDPGTGQMTLIVRAGGFAERSEPLTPNGPLDIVLAPAGLFESVTVTPTRTEQRLGDVPASISVVDKEQIRQSPATGADDVLRQVPTFSLFRRTGSQGKGFLVSGFAFQCSRNIHFRLPSQFAILRHGGHVGQIGQDIRVVRT